MGNRPITEQLCIFEAGELTLFASIDDIRSVEIKYQENEDGNLTQDG